MITASLVAKHLISLAGEGPEPEPMTAMKLHKLLYYCQGWHLAWYGKPLFPESIEAWQHGPVVPAVYNQFAKGSAPLVVPNIDGELPGHTRDAVEQVWSHYQKFSASGLRNLSHQESPYKNHYDAKCPRAGEVIPVEELNTFFAEIYREKTGDQPGTWDNDSDLVPLESLPQVLGW